MATGEPVWLDFQLLFAVSRKKVTKKRRVVSACLGTDRCGRYLPLLYITHITIQQSPLDVSRQFIRTSRSEMVLLLKGIKVQSFLNYIILI